MARLITQASSDERIASIMRMQGTRSTADNRRVHHVPQHQPPARQRRPRVRAGKTGFISKAGYCLATCSGSRRTATRSRWSSSAPGRTPDASWKRGICSRGFLRRPPRCSRPRLRSSAAAARQKRSHRRSPLLLNGGCRVQVFGAKVVERDGNRAFGAWLSPGKATHPRYPR